MTSACTSEWSSLAKSAARTLTLQENIPTAGHVLMFFFLSSFLQPPIIQLFMPNSTVSLRTIVRLTPNWPVVNVLLNCGRLAQVPVLCGYDINI